MLVFYSMLAVAADHIVNAHFRRRGVPIPTAVAIEPTVRLIEDGKIATVATRSQMAHTIRAGKIIYFGSTKSQ